MLKAEYKSSGEVGVAASASAEVGPIECDPDVLQLLPGLLQKTEACFEVRAASPCSLDAARAHVDWLFDAGTSTHDST